MWHVLLPQPYHSYYYCLIKHCLKHCMCLSGGNFPGTIKDCLFISDGHSAWCSINNLCYYLKIYNFVYGPSETCTGNKKIYTKYETKLLFINAICIETVKFQIKLVYQNCHHFYLWWLTPYNCASFLADLPVRQWRNHLQIVGFYMFYTVTAKVTRS
jgi:hypothetical protein